MNTLNVINQFYDQIDDHILQKLGKQIYEKMDSSDRRQTRDLLCVPLERRLFYQFQIQLTKGLTKILFLLLFFLQSTSQGCPRTELTRNHSPTYCIVTIHKDGHISGNSVFSHKIVREVFNYTCPFWWRQALGNNNFFEEAIEEVRLSGRFWFVQDYIPLQEFVLCAGMAGIVVQFDDKRENLENFSGGTYREFTEFVDRLVNKEQEDDNDRQWH